ncbi:MAG: PEP/pyruvate-binding domain-containing protein [Gammaproteobacteria bacterium]
MQLPMYARLVSLLLTLVLSAASVPVAAVDTDNSAKYRQWIMEMKTAERGPFSRLRWFCKDGAVLPPQPFGCAEHEGGHQHGEWSEKTRELRADGYQIANVLAGVDAAALTMQPDFLDLYNQLLIERFLVSVDNGWILRRALFYRGAIQDENERAGGRDLLVALSGKPEWITLRYPALRIGASLVPHGKDSASVQRVRQLSASLSDEDPGFITLRGKVHGTPDAQDAQRVRDYAAAVKDPERRAKYETLAAEIDLVYTAVALPDLLEQNARVFTRADWLQKLLLTAATSYSRDSSASNRLATTAQLLADLRDVLPDIRQTVARLRILDLSLQVEADYFRASAELRGHLSQATRRQRLDWLAAAVDAAYGTGLINRRSRSELEKSLARLDGNRVPLAVYRQELGYLARVPGWAVQTLRFQFHDAMQKLSEIEPLALHFIPDQLRGSPLLFYSQVLDSLLRDANRQAGVRYQLFGEEIGAGFRALNPGLARGVLHARSSEGGLDDFDPHGIYLLPETTTDLPPVAGILTAGEGNPLSHIQLLARNLGIPNVGVDEDLLPKIAAHDGERVVLAVSPAGLVELAQDGEHWNAVFGEDNTQQAVVIRPDLDKLDLGVRDFIDLDALRASDSGRIVGPKAAKLGELRSHFPEAVAPGLAIPFGVFRETVLEQPYRGTDQTVFDWMVVQYRRLETLPVDSAQRREATEAFRAELYELVAHARLDPAFQQRLHTAMVRTFGSLDGLGVFIRSDTNVEDLPGFTGAGLNLTLPNVVGFDTIVTGISRVWASPFTARAFAWRQTHMEHPEDVYPAVLLLKSVPNDKSGVMVTADIDTGNTAILSVAVNEGVGGAVDGQSAESLCIDTRDASVRVLATATAPWRRMPAPGGGIETLPVSGDETVLQPAEIRQLIQFARQLPQRFPPITDDAGNPVPADIEFGFLDGKLQLFQLRPFLESRQAQGSAYLQRMDQALEDDSVSIVDMQEVPQ